MDRLRTFTGGQSLKFGPKLQIRRHARRLDPVDQRLDVVPASADHPGDLTPARTSRRTGSASSSSWSPSTARPGPRSRSDDDALAVARQGSAWPCRYSDTCRPGASRQRRSHPRSARRGARRDRFSPRRSGRSGRRCGRDRVHVDGILASVPTTIDERLTVLDRRDRPLDAAICRAWPGASRSVLPDDGLSPGLARCRWLATRVARDRQAHSSGPGGADL